MRKGGEEENAESVAKERRAAHEKTQKHAEYKKYRNMPNIKRRLRHDGRRRRKQAQEPHECSDKTKIGGHFHCGYHE